MMIGAKPFSHLAAGRWNMYVGWCQNTYSHLADWRWHQCLRLSKKFHKLKSRSIYTLKWLTNSLKLTGWNFAEQNETTSIIFRVAVDSREQLSPMPDEPMTCLLARIYDVIDRKWKTHGRAPDSVKTVQKGFGISIVVTCSVICWLNCD